LVTGGSGSFGQAFVRRLLEDGVGRVAVFSRDELKQHEMRAAGFVDERLRWFIGDVRDRDRLELAMHGVDVVVHAAAMKQVAACEYNPGEAKATNVDGAENVIWAARRAGVSRVLALGTDKAVDPTNLYGATKLVAEKLFVDANYRDGGPLFSCLRYGNVVGSRGSVLPLWEAQLAAGLPLLVTDPTMTRFVLTLEQGVQFVLDCLGWMAGGEVFVPKVPAVSVGTMAAAVAWPDEPTLLMSGVRQGEKRHEVLVSPHEAGRTWDCGSHYVVAAEAPEGGVPVRAGFRLGSDTVEHLGIREFRALAGLTEAGNGQERRGEDRLGTASHGRAR
jgi:UDP-N-acetylglucosamine 4,6-dehydratase